MMEQIHVGTKKSETSASMVEETVVQEETSAHVVAEKDDSREQTTQEMTIEERQKAQVTSVQFRSLLIADVCLLLI